MLLNKHLFSRYSIDWKSDLDSYFDIDPVEGTISTNELLDRENIAQHNISVVATKLNSPVLTSRVAVTVHVLDINEFPPELASPYETFVCENAKVGQVPSLLISFSVYFRSSYHEVEKIV
ncbi:Cadherin-12 [Ameca splendens]|uniref:Cadherin-12 n=1 Tax=Ameca splendens TaxID=208324 RepID=A0ABV0XGD5_9TELE